MLALKQAQWILFKICQFNECLLIQTSLYNLKRTYLCGTYLFCNSYNVMRTKCRNKKRPLKKTKLVQTMAALINKYNKTVSKTESTEKMQTGSALGTNTSAGDRTDPCSKQGNSRNRHKESTNSGKETYRKSRSNTTKQSTEVLACQVNLQKKQNDLQLTSFGCQNYNVNLLHQNVLWSNFYSSQNFTLTHPPSFSRSLSESHVQRQHVNMINLNHNGLSYNQYNRNPLRRSVTADSANRTSSADKDKQQAWNLRTWQRTPFGKKLGKKKSSSSSSMFSIMSYNVLAQELLTEHSYLYRNHKPKALLWEQRWYNLLGEIKQHDADILCFQEVQESHIENYYNELKKLGYEGVFKQRTGVRTDGCAVYYKTSVFNLVEHTTVEFNQSGIPVLNRDNVAIIAKFSPKNNKENEFVVATTHLLYNPRREDVRLAQTQVLLSEVDRMAFKKHSPSGGHIHLPIIITGDFNLTPDSSVYSLITHGYLQYENLTNRSLIRTNASSSANVTGKNFLPSSLGITDQCQHVELVEKRKENIYLNREEELQHVHLQHTERYVNDRSFRDNNSSLFCTGTLSHDLSLISAYEHRRGDDIEATTFQDQWITVDYIFYSGTRDAHDLITEDKLKLVSRYTIPTRKYLKGVRIPNFAFGSDHFSLVAKFKLKA